MRKILTTILLLLTAVTLLQAQITIGGSVYGGGNAGDVSGNTNVTVNAGDLNEVFGGARQADVGGHAFVNINGENASDYILINRVYGGNDISGNIGTSKWLPKELTDTTTNGIDNNWNAFVRVSSSKTYNSEQGKVYLGQLFGGGNGAYDYDSEKLEDNKTDNPYHGLSKPELGRTYLEIVGGSIVYAFGGGNNATVTDSTVIYVNNESEVVNSIKNGDTELLTDARIKAMDYNPGFTYPTSAAFQIGSFFGGNNLAEMKIQPKWNLQRGKIRNLYSGGNRGEMTCPYGLLLEIDPQVSDEEKNKLVIDNVYGGCRMADVHPKKNGFDVSPEDVKLTERDEKGELKYKFPAGLSARVLVRGGDINNVYGGNDITGRVYGGNAVGIYTSIRGDVYGGGNGAYPYTDNDDLKNDPTYGDLYYVKGNNSVEALNAFRPNAEQVSIRLAGTESKPTIIGGSVYVGGNCATLATTKDKPMVELKIGSYVYADNVFLGNNGEGMVQKHEADPNDEEKFHDGVLRTYKKTLEEIDNVKYAGKTSAFNSMDLTKTDTFADYMDGVVMELMPSVVFDEASKDPADYIEYSSYFGSVFCGGNIGSMRCAGETDINFQHKIVIFNKLVGGSNNANVEADQAFNAAYEGGLIGTPDTNGNKLKLTLTGLKIQPKRWKNPDNRAEGLIWNTISASTGSKVDPVTTGLDASEAAPYTSTPDDRDRRLTGGNIYGGCYTSGHVNGNVIINLEETIFDRDVVFDEVELNTESGEPKLYGNDSYKITKRNSGVILDEQGMDVLGAALNVFGGGYGKDSEIWGSTTINLKKGYTFQIFGGSEQGVIGKPDDGEGEAYTFNGKTFKYNPKYSCTINVIGEDAGVYRGHEKDNVNMAEAEFIYGGGLLGPICGNTIINLGNGRVFNTFAGSCNADILGHTETYMGRQVNTDGTFTNGFPYIRDYVYGGNDLGGKILGLGNFESRVRTTADGYDAIGKVTNKDMLNASAYVEYQQGRVEKIFGGCYGVYDYTDAHYGKYFYNTDGEGTTDTNKGTARPGYSKPWLDNAFVNFRPTDNSSNTVNLVYGAGEGYLSEPEENRMQNRSYILVDIPQSMTAYQSTEIFGGGQRGGVGMSIDNAAVVADTYKASAVIDLARGQIKAVYGGSYEEGVTRRTEVNVPAGSTIQLEKIFGGAYGTSNEHPCDVYEANVNWNSSDALVGNYRTGIYGGNNAFRRTLYSKVNINAPVYYDKANKYYATVYGAGYGKDTWAQYTEVNLSNTAQVYEVYGGGQLGRVMNKKSVDAWKAATDTETLKIDLGLDGYTDTGLDNDLAVEEYDGKKYNTNVLIKEGAWVSGYMYNGALSGAYAYGGGLGDADTPNTGDVHGTTFIGLFGGKVDKDIYAAGTSGSVNNKYKVATDDFDNEFIASANAYIEGGTARNVYGGGWKGSVGYHKGDITETTANDVLGETHVVIGKKDGTSFLDGIPAIERNAYGGGEGGAVFGSTNITLNNGFIGYRHFDAEPTDKTRSYISVGGGYYQEKLDDETFNGDGTNRLYDSGCIFGGGYIDNSSVDASHVFMYGGHVRNSLFGGGEIAAIGRGVIEASGENNSVRTLQGIYKAGQSNVTLYEGHVHRNVFGGGRGYNNLGEGGTLYSDGYVFGQTRVYIHGGEIGNETVSSDEERKGNGNVFGGGDIGYVYSAYEENGKLHVGIKNGVRYGEENQWEGYYYKYRVGDDSNYGVYTPGTKPADNDGGWIKDKGEYMLTEDCKVLVEPHARVKSGTISYGGVTYNEGDYVPTTFLNTLGKKTDGDWSSLDDFGIIIHNAVFAGGNTSSGSATVFANATTVFGNATASVHDVYNRDLITIGSSHVGGLYGDGNLTFVDGYRGLNITNYGTDYYSISKEISLSDYEVLPAREKAYYELRYLCKKECTDKEGKTYKVGSTISQDELVTLFNGITDSGVSILGPDGPNSDYWVANGVCSRYAGRPMNTIQRADFCGVWGSRMVLQGAPDRVPETVDYTNYTINRVRELSLNKKDSPIGASETDDKHKYHGNYFGIYNIVNYLGALSSDFDFGDEEDGGTPRTSDNTDTETYGPEYEKQTFFSWKKNHINDRKRNNGNSHNQVALASGVYLELTSEKSTGTGLREKDWGYITGVVELDLINVKTGIGGGFVYAKNEHGKRTRTGVTHHTITDLNQGAVSYKQFSYETDDSKKEDWQSSGNFVHSTQTIIDDCYNISGKYLTADGVPAHYWYIKGEVYVYDQYVSAYTGAPNAYSEQVEIPLTITAASHGKMKLLNVMPNKYAYYAVNNGTTQTKLEGDRKIVINDVEYSVNTPISYWDWYLLTPSEKALFVEDTYYVKEDCWIGETEYKAGTVLLSSEYSAIRGTGATAPTVIQKKEVNDEIKDVEVDFDFIFRSSNNLSHDTGYLLTYKVNNPAIWDTPTPTYSLIDSEGSILGQRSYKQGDIISEDIEETYQTAKAGYPSAVPGSQAIFEKAYIVTSQVTIPASGSTPESRYYAGTTISATEADNSAFTGYVDDAFVCTHTIQLSATEYIFINTKMSKADKDAYLTTYADNEELRKEINERIVPAYYCISPGLYGGNYYKPGVKYRALDAWASMSEDDRKHFSFNYDALDLLIDPTYSRKPDGTLRHPDGQKYQYDSAAETLEGAQNNPPQFSLEQPVDYTATYNGTETGTYNGVTLSTGGEYTREQYESLPNEQRYYSIITVKDETTIYVVNNGFQLGNTPYAVGTTISRETYNSLGSSEQANITVLKFSEDDKDKKFYYCREAYEIGTGGTAITSAVVEGATAYSGGSNVPVGVVIGETNYSSLVNHQQNFTIHGIAPTEVTTLYVSRESDIFDLSKEKIITVIYEYDYEESDSHGNVTPVSERHVVNIHIEFKSGIPIVEDIKHPQIILPGTKLGLREPVVTPGAYEITGGGWELFENIDDAESHINGIDYLPNSDQLYWYQDGYYVAYYAKTYLGKTYSNHEPISVANYHNLTKVMDDKDHHYYVDNPTVKRDPKIYITDGQNGVQQLKDFFDLSVHSTTEGVTDGKVSEGGALQGHALLNKQIESCGNLDIIMHTNVEVPEGTEWTPIANETGECFEGTLHGDGYYISGLNNSLFNHLCGSVYNLGVMGSFTGAGIAETGKGYVENCWVSTSSTAAKTSKPVFGNPTRGDGYQIVNCYYQEEDNATNNYTNHESTVTYGIPTRMPASAFYNGTVAYDLNGFYLYKRYNDGKKTASGTDYTYYTIKKEDGTLSDPQTGHYEQTNAQNCSSGVENIYLNDGYVEDRYGDGDFRYADGTIPETDDVRTYVDNQNRTNFYPIWPDDYLYFGQMLTYKWNEARPHEEIPSHIFKSSGRLVDNDQSNRVYRAPAYYQSKEMDVAHFNPAVNLVAYSKPQNQYDTNLTAAYPNMTAIDFAGHDDTDYKLGHNGKWFYQPLLDDDGLISIVNRDETPNLLVYAPSSEQNEKTFNVLTGYFTEPVYREKYHDDNYRCVDFSSTQSIYGHLIQSGLTATNDHQLVDKRDFNCPISYSFDNGHRMWYQRTPDLYVGLDKGWETVSLPFSAELVTTHQKGEITHFYTGSDSIKDSKAKIGHEYWLREFKGRKDGKTDTDLFTAIFNYPEAVDADEGKTVSNTFLWDYYYSKNSQKDLNTDTYQTYYSEQRNLTAYPLLTNGKPYIIGFPGTTYYEFDLSGGFIPQHTAETTPARLNKQVITFASRQGETIGVSDEEIERATTSEETDYSFVPNYLSKSIAVGEGYLMNAEGNQFAKTTTLTSAIPFRPYFIAAPAPSRRAQVQSIVFESDDASFAINDHDPRDGNDPGELLFKVRQHHLLTTSTLRKEADVRIYNVGGQAVASFIIQPGETIETNIHADGVYIIHAANGQYTKKIAVK